MTKTMWHIAIILLAALTLALGALPWTAYGDNTDEELDCIYLEVPLNQSGAGSNLPDDSTAQIDEGVVLLSAPRARSYPVEGSKADLLKARLHTQLTAMVETINVRDLHIKRDSVDIGALYKEVVDSDPDLFYVTSGLICRYNTNKSSPTYGEIAEISPAANYEPVVDPATGKTSYKITQAYAFTPDQAAEMKASYEEAMQDALSWIPEGATDLQKAKAIHDWLLDHCSYNHEAAASTPSDYGWEPWTSYSGLVTGSPVCQGYALAFLACMNRAGVEASYVTDKASNPDHGWNRVQVDGDWYNLDVTYDDSDTYEETHFFMKSDEWWTANPDPAGYHLEWHPAGEAGTNTQYDEDASWTRYTEPASSAAVVQSFTLNWPEAATMTFDGTIDLAIDSVEPADANTGLAVWSSSDPAIATVDNAGRVTAGTTPGTATITCMLGEATCTFTTTVLGNISLDAFDFQVGQTEFYYTGESQSPTLEQHLLHADSGDLVLEEGVDYTIVLPEDSTSVGEKTMTVKGTGLYTQERTFAYRIVANDKTALEAALAQAREEQPTATASSTGADVAKDKLWVPTRVAQDLQSAMDRAAKLLATKDATAQEIDEATRALRKATEAYTAAKKPGTKPATWKRLWGDTALDTMSAIAREGWSGSKVAILATSQGHWDALSASALAGQHGAPVLMTDTATLSNQASTQLARLKPATVYICGGVAAVSPAVEQQVRSMGIKVVRLAGDTAIGTACEIADSLANPSKTCIVATLDTYQDALSISPYAYANQTPIYLCDKSGLDAQTKASIAARGFTSAVIVGGFAAVPQSVTNQLAQLGCTVKRLGGQDAYDTSGLIASWELTQGMQANRLAIATCTGGYWDALCGAALCGKNNAVLLLADDANRTTINGFARENGSQVLQGYVFGGTAAVSQATFDAAKKAVS